MPDDREREGGGRARRFDEDEEGLKQSLRRPEAESQQGKRSSGAVLRTEDRGGVIAVV